jgi:hypothetical protein
VRARSPGGCRAPTLTAGNLVNEQVVLTTIAGRPGCTPTSTAAKQTFLRRARGPAKRRAPAVRMGLANEAGYPHTGQARLHRQPAEPADRRDPHARQLRQPRRALRARAGGAPDHGHQRALQAVLVPERAIGTDQTKKFVVVVGPDGQPQFRDVQLGTLQDGMRVVAGGQLKPARTWWSTACSASSLACRWRRRC